MKIKLGSLMLVSAIAGLSGSGNLYADPAQADAVKRGKAHYLFFCASCHGVKADGIQSPNAEFLKITPSDLTALRQTGDDCIAERVLKAVSGLHSVSDGQEKEMPVFSENLEGKTVYQIVQYLKTIQQ